MQYTQGSLGRVFVLRLEHGDPMPACVVDFAREHAVNSALVVMVGGVDDGSRLVVGPRDGTAMPPDPMVRALSGVHETAAVGILAPDEQGNPGLHMHAACGREGNTVTGCIRTGISTWQVLEVVIIELVGVNAARIHDPATGFALLTACASTGEKQE